MKTIFFFLLLVVMPLEATTLFSDDFESYTAGANLAGQDGWTGCGSIPTDSSGALMTQVARADIGSAGCGGSLQGFALISHSFTGSVADNVLTTLSFDAYAPPGAHGSGVWLTDLGGVFVNGLQIYPDHNTPGWTILLYENGAGNKRLSIPGGIGTPVFFQVQIDVPQEIVYVIYDFGSGPQTTSSLSIAGNTTLAQWDEISVVGDYRFGLPQDQIDNITLTQSPEPSMLVPTAFFGCGLLWIKRRRRRVRHGLR